MKTNAIAASLLASALLLPLAACSQTGKGTDTTQPGTAGTAASEATPKTASSFIASKVREGIDQAKQEMLTKDIGVNDVHVGNESRHVADQRPKAVITPQGVLEIAGKPVDATPAQHTLLLDYRQQLIGIVDAGLDIGASGADIGMAAARQAIWGAFTGKSDQQIEASIKPQTDAIQAAAMKLCKRMPDLLASQQKLAAAMPAFKPYATMTQQDVDDCGTQTDKNGKKGFAVFSD